MRGMRQLFHEIGIPTRGKGLYAFSPQVNAWVDESGDKLAYVESTCAICNDRHSDHSICYLYVGSVSEAVQWATGREYEVIETHCLAKGDEYCRFEVGDPKA